MVTYIIAFRGKHRWARPVGYTDFLHGAGKIVYLSPQSRFKIFLPYKSMYYVILTRDGLY